MATSNINDEQQLSFEDGGKIEITDGANTYVVMRILPGGGNITLKDGGRDIREDTDQGALQTPRLGNDRPCEIDFDVRYTSDVGTDGIEALLRAEGTAGAVKLYTLLIRWYGTRGGSTGKTYSYTNAYSDLQPIVKPAGQFDTLSCKMRALVTKPTVAAFP